MIEHLPNWINFIFVITCLLTLGLFHFANGKPKQITILIIVWSIVQSVLAFLGFYQVTDSIPPRFALVLIPSILLVVYGLLPKRREFIFHKRDLKISTFLHVIRLPVEIVLFGLFTHKMIPELMTFEGRNYDILIGISAPVIGRLFLKNKISHKLLLLWNLFGLGLVLFILINGILSAELPFQKFGFEQPNRAINYFPFVLLPATIVPIVIYTHLSDIIKIRKEINTKSQNRL